jgi:hypothetical protein
VKVDTRGAIIEEGSSRTRQASVRGGRSVFGYHGLYVRTLRVETYIKGDTVMIWSISMDGSRVATEFGKRRLSVVKLSKA